MSRKERSSHAAAQFPFQTSSSAAAVAVPVQDAYLLVSLYMPHTEV